MVALRPARPEDEPAIAAVLALAFRHDPGTVVFEPYPGRRARILPVFFARWVRAAIADGGDLVVPANGDVTGVASWFGPARHGPGEGALAAAGWADVLETFGEAAAQRMTAMTTELERRHEAIAGWPHLRLDFFGVLPAAQGSGLGTSLLEHGHRRADVAGLRSYLETFSPANVTFYERRGWHVEASYVVAGSVPVWAMVREPLPIAAPAPGEARRC